MGDVIRLRAVRKAKARATAEAEAAANRARFGRSRQERAAIQAEDLRQARGLDGHRLDPTAGTSDVAAGDDIGQPMSHVVAGDDIGQPMSRVLAGNDIDNPIVKDRRPMPFAEEPKRKR